jgi:hypothetical protein
MADVTIKGMNVKDRHHLRAAKGWLELGDYLSASAELEEMTAEARWV